MNLVTVPTIVVVLARTVFGQTVVIGPPNPHYCQDVEQIEPNLKLIREVRVTGRITDQTGAPVPRGWRVELRRYVSPSKQVPVRVVATGKDGAFDLGLVTQGDYRLLPSPHRGFRQPDRLDCPAGQRECTLDIELKANRTDLPAAACPVR
jgi:hypothetical protein